MHFTYGIALVTIFCLGTIAVFPAHALVPPTNPNMAVRFVDPGIPGAQLINPQWLAFDTYHVWNGTTFVAQAWIENLDIGWALTGVNFTLSYNASLTNLVNAVLDPGWAGPGNVVNATTPGMIDVVANSPANPSGDVLVLTITFQIQGQHITPPYPLGNYDASYMDFNNISLKSDSESIPTDPAKNGVVEVLAALSHPAYDVSVTGIAQFPSSIYKLPPKSVIGQGFNLIINVTGKNYGWQEASFKVTAYANTTIIGSENMTTLGWGMNSTTDSIVWSTTGFNKGNYLISANATHPDEPGYYFSNNNLSDGWVAVATIGDITGSTIGVPDGKVDIRDLAAIAKIYGVNWWLDPTYDVNLDLTGPTLGVPDGKIDIRDMALAAMNYGTVDP